MSPLAPLRTAPIIRATTDESGPAQLTTAVSTRITAHWSTVPMTEPKIPRFQDSAPARRSPPPLAHVTSILETVSPGWIEAVPRTSAGLDLGNALAVTVRVGVWTGGNRRRTAGAYPTRPSPSTSPPYRRVALASTEGMPGRVVGQSSLAAGILESWNLALHPDRFPRPPGGLVDWQGDPRSGLRCRRGVGQQTREYGTWADWLGVPRHTFSRVRRHHRLGRDYRETFQVFRPGFDLAAEREARAAAGQPERSVRRICIRMPARALPLSRNWESGWGCR